MHLDLKAANEFEVSDEELAAVFEDRDRSQKEYGPLFEGAFQPYVPSENIIKKFAQKAEEFAASDPNYVNPFEQAAPMIIQMIEDMAGSDLSKPFNFKLSDYGLEEEQEAPAGSDPTLGSLPEQPMPNQQIVQAPQMSTAQGLTPTELALLSQEEQQIRLKQRGLA